MKIKILINLIQVCHATGSEGLNCPFEESPASTSTKFCRGSNPRLSAKARRIISTDDLHPFLPPVLAKDIRLDSAFFEMTGNFAFEQHPKM